VQTLVDTAMMVVAVVIPPLHSQCRQKALHRSPPINSVSHLQRFDVRHVTTS
jgi:hypothetical protein